MMSVDKNKSLTYRDAGVDVEAGHKAVELMRGHVRATFRREVMGDIGGFGGLFALGKYDEPILVSGTDGVGTKLKVAFMLDRHDTVGVDLVAMSVNDILVSGAEPLFFLDYIGVARLDPVQVAEIVAGVAKGCQAAGCALLGGETAELPDLYSAGEYDLAGFAVGVTEKKRIVDGSTIKQGDVLIGLPSSGLHSNGYSLARKLAFEIGGFTCADVPQELGVTVGDELLRPTRIYVRQVLPLVQTGLIRGMVHITGGGFIDNIPRVLPAGLGVEIERGSWPVLPVFGWLKELGQVAVAEMFRTFNMGIGFVLVVAESDVAEVRARLIELGEASYVIGKVIAGEGVSLV
ncbi:MAG: Phosphoribosylformylglycinamidine cyclo-ligase [Firmicutes bacterium]|nr:Phosphoribosylformylglycinamidine cyclo-ligase [Bacillota bacterium]